MTSQISVTSLSARRAWIEIGPYSVDGSGPERSLSARRAWIEIGRPLRQLQSALVALRKESVDRNITALAVLLMYSVALRKESVDRNAENPMISVNKIPSLSARRAWIEIIPSA